MRLSTIFSLGVLLCFSVHIGWTQQETPTFFADVVAFRGTQPPKHRVDVYAVIPYELLLFVREHSAFVARYEFRIHYRNIETSKEVFDTVLFRMIAVDNEDVALGYTGDFDSLQILSALPPGRYQCTLSVYDQNADATYSRTIEVKVIDYWNHPVSLSGILLLSGVEKVGESYVIYPHPSSDITPLLPDDLFLYVEAYAKNIPDRLACSIELREPPNTVVYQWPVEFIELKESVTPIIRNLPFPEQVRSGTYQLAVFLQKPKAGENADNQVLAMSVRSVAIRTNILRYSYITADELENMILQLRYVAEQSEIAYILEGKTVEEKRRRFLEFWAQRDPTPGTDRNEAYEEYYRRVAEANRLFSDYRPGWQTDRGKVYIIYGPPESREQYVDPQTGLYMERWYYSGNRVFVFVDYSGFGDYRLLTPLSPSEKFRYP